MLDIAEPAESVETPSDREDFQAINESSSDKMSDKCNFQKSGKDQNLQMASKATNKFGGSSAKFGESSVKFGESSVTDTQARIIKIIAEDPRISAAKIAASLNLSVRAIEKNIKELREKGILLRHGAAHGGYWEIITPTEKKPE